MNVPFYIARRYLFSKKSHNAINTVSLVSACGVMVATVALVCALSVMNGFETLIFSMFGSLDPELKITPRMGKTFDPAMMEELGRMPGIDVVSEVLQDNALIRYGDRQVIGLVKGVDDRYRRLTSIDSILVDGDYCLSDEVTDYATLGIGLASALGITAGFTAPLELYAPKRNEQVNLANPSTSFNVDYCYITAVFRTNQQTYDESLMIVPLALTRHLFNYESEVSALELRLSGDARPDVVKSRVRNLVGQDYVVADRYEQQDVYFRMMQSEKWMIFLILCFILLIALFNLTGSLSMLMIEKQDDVRTLRAMGAGDRLIRRIFLLEGWMISALGALTGVVVGLALCLLQQEAGLIKMGAAGTFVVDNYPVEVAPSDILIILATVLGVGFLSAWYPVYYLGNPSKDGGFRSGDRTST
ncbi:MAG: FtsX-like permease family protein [Tannerellaceae bacterium]|jgi:ABC-type lipoprotein release transport system permease subunit|nr:FtsX-like permease family protein [Tannerellaceae bacterium]